MFDSLLFVDPRGECPKNKYLDVLDFVAVDAVMSFMNLSVAQHFL